jgi:hypothetical protein
MTAPLNTRRHYVNGAPQATLGTGINAAVATFALSTGTGWPATPFPLILDFAGAAEEVVLIKAMGGATVTDCTRGYDGTTAQAHSVGALCVHGIIAKDAEEASQHTSAVAAHGATSALVGKDDAQTLTNKTISSSTHQATATDPAVNAKAAATGSAPVINATDSTGSTTLFQVPKTGPVAMLAAAVTGALSAASAAISGALSAASATISGLLTAGTATISGALSAASATVTGAVTAGSVSSSGAVTGNNLPVVRTADAGKKLRGGTFTAVFTAINAVTGTLNFPESFGAPPDFIVGTVQVGSNLDLIVNWQTAPSAASVTWRVSQKDGTAVSGTATVHWFAFGPA